MIYFIAFTFVVIISSLIYLITKSLKLTIGLPLFSYIALIAWYLFTAKESQSANAQAQLLFFLGTPMIFFASLLAPYIIEKYIGDNTNKNQENVTENDSNRK